MNPRLFTASTTSREPIVDGSKLTFPFSVERATEAAEMPGILRRLDSMRWTQEEQVMPLMDISTSPFARLFSRTNVGKPSEEMASATLEGVVRLGL